jgi:hypothetical protein
MEYALAFILLHEYGHVHYSHLDESFTRRMSIGEGDVDIYVTSHEQEFEADDFAARKLFYDGEDHLLHNTNGILAVTLLLLLFDLCEQTHRGVPPKSEAKIGPNIPRL